MGLLSALGNLVRCRCRQVWGDGQDPYRAPADDQQVASPASIKISTDNEHQIEVKIKYNVNSRLKEQLYQLDLFMFFPEELEAVHTDFYEDLWQIVRLHTPKVALSSLASGHGVSTAIAAKVQEVRLKTKAGEECREPADTLVQQLRLHTCVFRSANRKATRQAVHCLKKLKAAMDAGESIRENQRLVARLLHDLVAHSCGAIQDLQRICQPCLEPDMPELVRQGWALADEFMLCEAKRAFMKLLRDIDKLDMFKASTVLQAEAATDHASLVLPLQQEESDSPVLSDLPPATPFAGARPVSLPASALSQPQPRSTADNAADQPPRDLEVAQRSQSADGLTASASAPSLEHVLNTARLGPLSHARSVTLPGRLSLQLEHKGKQGPLGRSTSSPSVHSRRPSAVSAQHMPSRLATSTSGAQPEVLNLRHEERSTLRANGHQNPRDQQQQQQQMLDGVQATAVSTTKPPIRPLSTAHRAMTGEAEEDGSHRRSSSFDINMLRHADSEHSVPPPRDSSLHEQTGGSHPQGSEQAGPGPSSESLLHHAHDLVSMAIYALRAESERRGYVDSIIHEDDPHQNEAYTNRIKVLKHNARAVVSMSHQVRKPSTLLVDVVGMTIAGMAMCLAVLAIWLASRLDGRGQFGPVYVTIIVVGYMLKDRMKEWGKRYLQPVASWFGFKFPDRIVHVVDQRGVRVGRCAETSKIVSDGAVPERVLLMRHHGTASPLRQATKPERVMTYHKEMKVRWDKLDPRLEGVTGLDDVMRIDLGRFCRRMQPGMEPHFRLQTTPDGRMHVSKVTCARVYHVNVVLRIRTHINEEKEKNDQKAMQLQSMRIVMSKEGIKRLEAADSPMLLSKQYLPATHLLHMPAMPRLSALTPLPQLLHRSRRPSAVESEATRPPPPPV